MCHCAAFVFVVVFEFRELNVAVCALMYFDDFLVYVSFIITFVVFWKFCCHAVPYDVFFSYWGVLTFAGNTVFIPELFDSNNFSCVKTTVLIKTLLLLYRVEYLRKLAFDYTYGLPA